MREQHVCSYCGTSCMWDGPGTGWVLMCGHGDTGEWDRGTHQEGSGRPVPTSEYSGPTKKQHAIEKERIRREIRAEDDAWGDDGRLSGY